MIDVVNLTKVYRGKPAVVAVAGLSFRVEPGHVLGLVGPNGAGKTSTLRAIAGIIPPTEGSISIAGVDMKSRPVEAKRRLAYVPDDPKLFDALTVWEHIEFSASVYQVNDYRARGEALLVLFELTEKRDALAQELSRGMRQKLALCCAYLHDPAAIMLDEPMTGLDPRGIRTMKESVRERAASGAAVIISSHLLALVEDLCTHLLIVHKGTGLYFGSASGARDAYDGLSEDASLEDVFFRATEGTPLFEAAPPEP